MPAVKHYFIEQTSDGRFGVRAEGSESVSDVFETEQDAIAHVKMVNPDDHPDIERIRDVGTGGRD